ncbi:hypothetical protein PMIN06_011613 [Paraphaeosphaeria minitans]|uniref:Homeobox domain-containing protein n=1 Tax=Paraphaeosphaeria minitans TaxID=565426 RepID=A0A9P6GTH6_9PLEO|nr:hypothetical protein PMIN01_00492 [Paraphaeosphaeria minitans]
MQSLGNSSDAASQPPPSVQDGMGSAKATTPVKPPGTADVKPRLTKEQHDILERHFQNHHKPSTSTKKGFAENLGVPLDKINNWFQNRRAKVKQDLKKQMNQYNMQMGLYNQPQVPGAPPMQMSAHASMPHFAQHLEQAQTQMSLAPGYFPVNADISPATMPVQNVDQPSALNIGPSQQQMMLQQQYDMHHSLRSIPEAERGNSYHPNAVMHSIMAATAGPSYMQNNAVPMQQQGSSYVFDNTPNGLPSDGPFSMPNDMSAVTDTSDDDQFGGFQDYLSYLPIISTAPTDLQITAGSLSADDSPYSGTQSNTTNPSSIEPNAGSVASLTSKYSGWTDTNGIAETKQESDTDDFFASPYNMPQASASEANFWGPNTHSQGALRPDMYQQSNASAHAILSSPHNSGRSLSTGPADYETPSFGDEVFTRRNSSTSNLASNIEAIHIQTPEGFRSPTQSSIAARRQKRPATLNANSFRSASYSGSMPSPGNNNNNSDHTLRRIRSSGIGNPGRVQKPQPGSAQRSPMSLTFSEAASSPKFQRTLSSSSITTVGLGGSMAPPTPQTPNEPGRFPYWQSNPTIRTSMPDHSSPESMAASWAMEQAGSFMGESPPSLEAAQLHQARLGGDMYRDTPPQSAPATQQGFPRQNMMQPPRIRAACHSSTDLTLQQPKPSHFRRPSLPVDAQGQGEDPNVLFGSSYGGFNYDDISLSGIQHNVPFAPPVSAMPDFLVNQYIPPGDGYHGHMRRTTAPEAKNYIFANQGPRDFRS